MGKPDLKSLEDIVRRFARPRILVIGDVILDRYLWGEVDRVSPEAPVPVVRLRNDETRLGGAANVIANLAALDARAELVGVVGRDAEAEALRKAIGKLKIPAAGLLADAERPTTIKTRVMALGQQLLRLDQEATAPIDGALGKRLLAYAKKALRRCDLLVLSDYGKGVLGDAICTRLIAMARTARKPVVVDPKGFEYQKYRGATVIKPNRKEAEAAAGKRIVTPEDLALAARRIQRVARVDGLVISRGGQGVSVFEPKRRPITLPARAQAVYDVTGAGDTFIAVMSLALAVGASIVEAAALGNLAGSVVVGKLGAATLSREELLSAIEGWRAA